MKKKLTALLIAISALMSVTCVMAFEDDYTKANLVGGWYDSEQKGYRGSTVQEAEGNDNTYARWLFTGAGDYRLYYWKGVDPVNGAKNAKIVISAEGGFEKVFDVDFSRGNAGWNELGLMEISGAGGTVEVSAPQGLIFASAIRYDPLDKEYGDLFIYTKNYKKHVLLQTGSQNAYVDAIQYKIPDTAPEVIDGTTFVPLRFVSEALGAEVLWDGAANSATVSYNQKSLVFTIGSDICYVDGASAILPKPVYLKNGRTMLPLRFIAEAFNKQVFWCPAGVISITEDTMPDAEKDSKMMNTISKILRSE